MSSALSLSQEQQQLLDNRVLPKGWIRQNPSFNPSPFPYFNSYTSPAWTNGLQGRGLIDNGPLRYSNQFTSALVQPPNPMHQVPQAGK